MCKSLNLSITVKNDEINYGSERFFSNETELLDDYLHTLFMNGQIYLDYYLIKVCDHEYTAFVNVPDIKSIESKFNNEYVNRSYKYLTVKIEKSDKNILYSHNCNCNDILYYILQGSSEFGTASPVTCGKCGYEVPLYKIPHLFCEQEHFSLLSWQKCYASVENLWINSLSDRFTKNQLNNPASALNKTAFELRQELEKKIGKPVYLELSKTELPISSVKEQDDVLCPRCCQKMTKCEYQVFSGKMYKCDICRVINIK